MDEPVIPMATPRRGEKGRIAYVGEDGRRYAVEDEPFVQDACDEDDAAAEVDIDNFLQMEDLACR
jgi:hypothetical protein